MNRWNDLAYAPEYGRSGLVDVYTPEAAPGCPVVMVIHGGGLKTFSKERMTNVALFLARAGFAVVNINYRLVSHSPFPAAVRDTLAAFNWLKDGNCSQLATCKPVRISLLGASAGGFLALAAGFILGAEQVRSIISISGPAQPGWYRGDSLSAGDDPRLFKAPTELAGAGSPPVLAIHSRNDRLVPPAESIEVVKALQAAGRPARLYLFDGPGEQHGIWQDGEQEQPHLFGQIEAEILDFLREMG